MAEVTLPGERTVRIIAAAVVVLAIGAWAAYVIHLRNVAGTAPVLEQALDVAQESGDIGRQASDNAGAILLEGNHASNEDRRAVAAARRPGATAADRERVRQRAREAYVEGQDADCRLQRADCRAKSAGAARE